MDLNPQARNHIPYRLRGTYHKERYKELKAEGICPRCLLGHADKMKNGRYYVYCYGCRGKNLKAVAGENTTYKPRKLK